MFFFFSSQNYIQYFSAAPPSVKSAIHFHTYNHNTFRVVYFIEMCVPNWFSSFLLLLLMVVAVHSSVFSYLIAISSHLAMVNGSVNRKNATYCCTFLAVGQIICVYPFWECPLHTVQTCIVIYGNVSHLFHWMHSDVWFWLFSISSG